MTPIRKHTPLHSRIETLENKNGGEYTVVRVGFDGKDYFPETKEDALIRHGVDPDSNIILVTYGE